MQPEKKPANLLQQHVHEDCLTKAEGGENQPKVFDEKGIEAYILRHAGQFPWTMKDFNLFTKAGSPLHEDALVIAFSEIERRLDDSRREAAGDLLKIIEKLDGAGFYTIEDRRGIANSIQFILNQINWSAICLTCGKPARLRVAKAIKYPKGAFQFVHVRGKKTTHQIGDVFRRFDLQPNDSEHAELES
jgi:hypothetical protein